jgi:hypothetical protein
MAAGESEQKKLLLSLRNLQVRQLSTMGKPYGALALFFCRIGAKSVNSFTAGALTIALAIINSFREEDFRSPLLSYAVTLCSLPASAY